MGHKCYTTTQQYIHVESEDLVEAADFLNPAYGLEEQMEPETKIVPFGKAS